MSLPSSFALSHTAIISQSHALCLMKQALDHYVDDMVKSDSTCDCGWFHLKCVDRLGLDVTPTTCEWIVRRDDNVLPLNDTQCLVL